MNALDISNYQGKASINLDAVLSENKVDILIAKGTEGVSFTDSYLDGFMTIAQKHNCLLGIYHYARPEKNSAVKEADYFYSRFKKYVGKAVPVLDWEVSSQYANVTWAKTWLERIENLTGSTPIFYSYESLINRADYTPINKYPLWVAKYKDHVIDYNFNMSNAGAKPVVKAWGGDGYIMWQWTSSGRINGYYGNLDCSIYYKTKEYWNNLITHTLTESAIDKVLDIALNEVGYKEGANNHTKYGDEMHKIQPSNMDKNAPWCDAFVDWCFVQAFGAPMAKKVLCGDFDDYTWNSIALYKKADRWTTKPSKGSQIFFGGSGHTGLVYKVTGNTVYTVEGNKADAVRKCSYKISDSSIVGYGLPKYNLVQGTIQEDVQKDEYDMPEIKKGSKGKAVKIWQVICGATIDGDFGNATLAATKEFQKAHNLTVDGIVGPKTWKVGLNSVK